jgi:hypothetical protein
MSATFSLDPQDVLAQARKAEERRLGTSPFAMNLGISPSDIFDAGSAKNYRSEFGQGVAPITSTFGSGVGASLGSAVGQNFGDEVRMAGDAILHEAGIKAAEKQASAQKSAARKASKSAKQGAIIGAVGSVAGAAIGAAII